MFKLLENALSFARKRFEYNATLMTSLFLALFFVSATHVYNMSLNDFFKHFPPKFSTLISLQHTLHLAI